MPPYILLVAHVKRNIVLALRVISLDNELYYMQ